MKPFLNLYVCDYLEKSLVSLYEEDSLFDKFFLDVSPDQQYVVTGGYNKSAHIIDVNGTNNVTVALSFDASRGKVLGKPRKYANNKKLAPLEGNG